MKSRFSKVFSALIAALLALVLPSAGLADGDLPAVGQDISGFTSVTFEGEPVDGGIFAESDLTVINIWQRWCGPCWVELPAFKQLHEYCSSTPESDVAVWGALYYGDNVSQIQEAVDYVAEYGYNWNHMLLCETIEQAVAADDGSFKVPQTLFVDRNGIVRRQVLGKIETFEELYGMTFELLEELRTEYYANTGDVNGSGSVDTADALLAMRYAMNLAELTPGAVTRGDINLDGRLDTADSMLIMRIGLGM